MMNASVCLSVSVCVCSSGTTRPTISEFFLCMPTMVVARSSSGGVMVSYVFPVLEMTSYLPIS